MIKLCRIDEFSQLADKQCREFTIELDGIDTAIFVIRHQNTFNAYINSCPHTGARLNWQPDIFLDYDKEYIQCGIHGALFRITDGYCVSGPCARQKLTALELQFTNGDVMLTDSI